LATITITITAIIFITTFAYGAYEITSNSKTN